jgi:hypothetical protein
MDQFAPLVVIAALVWAAVFFRFAGLWGLCVATLLAGTVVGYEFFRVGPFTADRILWIACLGGLLFYQRLGLTCSRTWDRSDLLLIVFLAAFSATTFLTETRLPGSQPFNKLLFYVVMPMGMYWVARNLEITPRQLRGLFGSMAILGLYVAVMATFEKFDMHWGVFPRYIVNPELTEFFGRGRGPLLNPCGNGLLLSLGISCLLMWFPQAGRGTRLIILGATGILLLGVYCTLTRCVWIGAAGTVGGIVWLAMPRRFRWPSAIFGAVVGIVFIGANLEKFKSFKRDKNVSVQDMQQSASLRPILATIAWKMFLDYPLTGVGTGQYLAYAGDYVHDRHVDLPLEKGRTYVQHNIFLSVLVENGLIALFPFALVLGVWCYRAWDLWHTKSLALEQRQMGLVFLGMMSAFLVNGMFHDLLIIPMVNMYLFFLAGVVRSVRGTPCATTASVNRLDMQRPVLC